MRLDHLLSKEILPIIPIGDSLVDHWLFGSVFSLGGCRVPPVPLEGAARPAPYSEWEAASDLTVPF